jgi:hypothetical protein
MRSFDFFRRLGISVSLVCSLASSSAVPARGWYDSHEKLPSQDIRTSIFEKTESVPSRRVPATPQRVQNLSKREGEAASEQELTDFSVLTGNLSVWDDDTWTLSTEKLIQGEFQAWISQTNG